MLEIEVKNSYIDTQTLKPMLRVTLNLDVETIHDNLAMIGDEFGKLFFMELRKQSEQYDKVDQLVETELFEIAFESKEDFKFIDNFMRDNNISKEDFREEYPIMFLNHVWTNIPGEEPIWLGSRVGFITEHDKLKYYTLLDSLKNGTKVVE